MVRRSQGMPADRDPLRDDALHGECFGRAHEPHCVVEVLRRLGLHVLHQPEQREGRSLTRNAPGGAMLVLGADPQTGPNRRAYKPCLRRRCGRLFRDTPEGEPNKRLGVATVQSSWRPRGTRKTIRRVRIPIRRPGRAAPGFLVRLHRIAHSNGVLASGRP